jgi:hypothetical protein
MMENHLDSAEQPLPDPVMAVGQATREVKELAQPLRHLTCNSRGIKRRQIKIRVADPDSVELLSPDTDLCVRMFLTFEF